MTSGSSFDLMAPRGTATFLCAAPTVLIGLAHAALEAARRNAPRGIRVLVAGAPPAAATIERVEVDLGWELTQVYGMTETAPLISICEPRPAHESMESGDRSRIKARQGVELVLAGELLVVDENGREVPHDGEMQGEIVSRGNMVMRGYFEDPQATAAAIRDGWMHTGDAAIVHPDGYIEIRDRLKDIIISGGENISSVEVEGILLRHPSVQECAVVGFPNEKWGESPRAFVVLKAGATATETDMRQFARDNMAHFKVPHAFKFGAGTAEDLDRQNSEVYFEERPVGDRRSVIKRPAIPRYVPPAVARACG